MRILAWLTGLACLCVQAAQAGPASCPPLQEWQDASLEQLSAFTEPCEENAVFQAYRGALLLVQGEAAQAAVALEKALMLNPDLPGAALDYAQALAQIGLKSSARALVQGVLDRPDIDPDLKTRLAPVAEAPGALPALSAEPEPAVRWTALMQAGLGRESNINNATHADSLTLLLNNGPITINLADTVKPRAGNAAKTLLAVQGASNDGLGEWQWGANLVARTSPGHADASNRTVEAALKYSLPMSTSLGPAHWQAIVGGTRYWLAGDSAYADRTAQLKFIQASPTGGCLWAPGLGTVAQDYPLSNNLNGRYSFGRIELTCRHNGSQETQWVLTSGLDRADQPTRLGGDKRRADLLMRHERLLDAGQLSAWLRYSRTQDLAIYSDLMGDLKTGIARTDWGFGYWHPLVDKWSAGFNFESTSQTSNNSLFQLKNLSLYAGLRWQMR